MKKILGIITTVLLLTANSFAQECQTVLSVTQEMHDESWYLEQQKLWNEEVKKDKTNAEAWYNYYSATRALKLISKEKLERDEYTDKGTQIATDAYAAIPNTFEGNHLMWWDSENGKADQKYLLAAGEIDSDDYRIFDDLMVLYKMNEDKENFDIMCKKIYNSGNFSPTILNWGYNVLAELEPNAVVFVRGDNDTYSLWLTQSVKEFRSDVTVLNFSLLKKDEYRKRTLQKLGYSEFTGDENELFTFLIEDRKDRSIYVSSSAIYGLKNDPIMDSLYLVGLTYLYCDYQFDNVSIIRRNYEKRYLIDYLTEQFSVHPSQDIAGMFDALYIPSMIKLYKHYCDSEEISKMEEIETLLLKISKKTGQEDQVKKLIKDC